MARRLETGEIVDPFDGEATSKNGVLRTVRPRSFAEDPLRIVRGLRLVSQLGLEPDEQTLAQMREEAASVALVSGERVGGGLARRRDGRALEAAARARSPRGRCGLRATPACSPRSCRSSSRRSVSSRSSERQHLPLDEHIFAVVQAAADADAPLAVRLGALFHDLGKPGSNGEPRGTWRQAHRGGACGGFAIRRGCGRYVTRLVRAHAFALEDVDELFARRFLREHGDELAFDLVAHKEADLRGKKIPQQELDAVARLRSLLEQERKSAAPARQILRSTGPI